MLNSFSLFQNKLDEDLKKKEREREKEVREFIHHLLIIPYFINICKMTKWMILFTESSKIKINLMIVVVIIFFYLNRDIYSLKITKQLSKKNHTSIS